VESLAGGAAHGGRDQAGQASVGAPDRPVAPAAMITLLVVDDHLGFRGTLEAVLRSAGDLFVLASAGGGEEAVTLAAALRPQVVVMDLVMPGVTGVDATRRMLAGPEPPVVVALSGSRTLIRDALAAGAACALLKESDPEDLLAAIRAAAGEA